MYLVADPLTGVTVPLSAVMKGGDVLEHARSFPVTRKSLSLELLHSKPVPLAEALPLEKEIRCSIRTPRRSSRLPWPCSRR